MSDEEIEKRLEFCVQLADAIYQEYNIPFDREKCIAQNYVLLMEGLKNRFNDVKSGFGEEQEFEVRWLPPRRYIASKHGGGRDRWFGRKPHPSAWEDR